MQRKNGDTDVENRLMDAVGKGESRMNGESSIDIYVLPCVKQIAGEKLLYNTGSPALRSNDLEGWDGGRRGRLKSGGICV